LKRFGTGVKGEAIGLENQSVIWISEVHRCEDPSSFANLELLYRCGKVVASENLKQLNFQDAVGETKELLENLPNRPNPGLMPMKVHRPKKLFLRRPFSAEERMNSSFKAIGVQGLSEVDQCPRRGSDRDTSSGPQFLRMQWPDEMDFHVLVT
jgi:hypothetical protein